MNWVSVRNVVRRCSVPCTVTCFFQQLLFPSPAPTHTIWRHSWKWCCLHSPNISSWTVKPSCKFGDLRLLSLPKIKVILEMNLIFLLAWNKTRVEKNTKCELKNNIYLGNITFQISGKYFDPFYQIFHNQKEEDTMLRELIWAGISALLSKCCFVSLFLMILWTSV